MPYLARSSGEYVECVIDAGWLARLCVLPKLTARSVSFNLFIAVAHSVYPPLR